MIPIKTLEIQMDALIRSRLRKVMHNVDPRDITTSLRLAEDRLTSVLYEPLYAQILKVYREGYIAGGNLIRRHAPRGTLLTAAAPAPNEDPRIAKATKDVIYGLKHSLGNHKNEIQATMRAGFEKGESIPKLSRRLDRYFDNNRAASTRFARTTTNDVFNRAHLDRYEDSGVVEGVQYSAHIDERTSEICKMLNGTIWRIGDSRIQVPPLHFACRSRLVPYFGKIPGKRDFSKDFDKEFIAKAKHGTRLFRSKYWSPMPHTKASATYQRSYFTKSDIKTINTGLALSIQAKRTALNKYIKVVGKGDRTIVAKRASVEAEIVPIDRLKNLLRYRKIDPDKNVIVDRFGKSLLLDRLDERDIIKAAKGLIAQTDDKIAKEALKRAKAISAAWKDVLATRKGIVSANKDILYYQKQIKKYPAQTSEFQKQIARREKAITSLKAQESRQVVDWNRVIDMKPSSATIMLEAEKERYAALLDGFKFQKR